MICSLAVDNICCQFFKKKSYVTLPGYMHIFRNKKYDGTYGTSEFPYTVENQDDFTRLIQIWWLKQTGPSHSIHLTKHHKILNVFNLKKASLISL